MFLILLSFLVPIFFGFSLYILFFDKLRILDSFVISVGFGFGFTSVILFVMNQFLGFELSHSNILILAFVQILFSFLILYSYFHRFRIFIKNISGRLRVKILNKLDFTEKVFFASVIFIYTLVSYKLFFFPIMNEDAMIAHMYVSKDIFFSNTLSTEVNSSYYTYHVQPTSMDLQYSWLYLVINEFDDIYPRFLILSHSILATAITYSLGKNITKSRKAGLLSCLLLVILISYPLNTIRPNKDISVAFYTLASFYYLYNNQGHKNNFLLFISGIFLGLALFTKYSAIPYYLSISIFLFFYYYHKSELSLDIDLLKERGPRFIREYSRIFFFITAGVLSIWAPFLIRNILIFGNPLYPFFSSTTPELILSNFETEGSIYQSNREVDLIQKIGQAHSLILDYFHPVVILLFVQFLFIKNSPYSEKLKFYNIITIVFVTIVFLFRPHTTQAFAKYLLPALPLISLTASAFIHSLSEVYESRKERFSLISFVFLNLFLVGIFLLKPLFGKSETFSPSFLQLILLLTLFTYNLIYLFREKFTNIFISNSQRFSKSICASFVVLLILPSSISIMKWEYDITRNTFPYVTLDHPSESDSKKYYFGEDWYYTVEWINNNLEVENSKVLAYTYSRYYFDIEIIPADSLELQSIYDSNNISASLTLAQNEGITHILHNTNYHEGHITEPSSFFDYCYNGSPLSQNIDNEMFFSTIYENPTYRLYEIR